MRLGLALAITILSAFPLHAEGRFALVIAASDYDQLRDLKNPVQDVTAIAAELDRLGFEVTVETERDARRTRRALEDFAEDAEGADIALVYYAGHGVEIGGENHLLPVDADAASAEALAASAIPLSEVAAALADIAPAAILLVDACRDDPFAGTALAADARSAKEIEGASDAATASDGRAIAPGFARMGRADGLLYAFATAPGAVALDGSGANSPYAEALLRHLGKSGLSLPTILTLVAQDVYDRSDNRQLPYFESALPDLVFLNAPPADLTERDALLLAMAELTPDLRAEVERIAALNGVPLAPLYAAMLSADLAGLTLTEREAQLTQAAVEYRAFIAQTASLGQDDPRIAALRDEAAELMRLGAYRAAQEKFAQALAIGESRAGSASEALVAETLSLVDTLKASAAYDEMREVLLARSAAEPENTGWLRELVVGFSLSGDTRRRQGNLAGAEEAYARAIEVAQKLAMLQPRNGYAQRDLALTWGRMGDVRRDLGDATGAETAYGKQLEITQALVALDPENSEWQDDLSSSWARVGDIRLSNGDLASAEMAYRQGLDIALALVAREPGNPERQRSLANGWESVGKLRHAQGDLAGAAAAFREVVKIRRGLVSFDPQNTEWQRDLALVWLRIGDVLQSQDDLTTADLAYRLALEITQSLTARDPGNSQWQRDLGTSWQRIAHVLSQQGDLDGAEASFQISLEIFKGLAASDPQNAELQRDVSVSWEKIGNIRAARGDLAGAETAYRAALEIRQAQADVTQGAAALRLELAVNHIKLAQVVADPRPHMEAALAILERLQAEGRLPAEQVSWIAEIRSLLAPN